MKIKILAILLAITIFISGCRFFQQMQQQQKIKKEIEHEKYIEPPATKQNKGATSFPND
jgi:hypothetical protein